MSYSLMIIGIVFMAISVYQLNKKTKMDDMIIQNIERKFVVLDREKFLRVEHTSKACFGAIVATIGMLEIWFIDLNTATIVVLVSVIAWQFSDAHFKKDYVKRK